MEAQNIISICALFLSLIVLIVTSIIAVVNWRKISVNKLFTGFDLASQMSIENPILLKKVHGISNKFDKDETASIAYLSLLLDSFQNYFGENTKKIKEECIDSSNFLNELLSNEDNQKRWNIIKTVYYGSFDDNFKDNIDKIIKLENSKSKSL